MSKLPAAKDEKRLQENHCRGDGLSSCRVRWLVCVFKESH